MPAAIGVAKGGRILVVDDEPMVRATLGQVLADEGYIVDAAVDGEEALACVVAARPDAILLDLMMPGMNGRQFLQALRNEPAFGEIPVLIMTAVHGLEVNLASIGASEVVEKPFDVDDLLNKIALAVYRSRDADRVAHPPFAAGPAEPPPETKPTAKRNGVVLVVENDRAHLQRLDLVLSERGYTVVSMTRALAQLSRLARALRPRAILLELQSEGVVDVARKLRLEPRDPNPRDPNPRDQIPLLVFSRGEANEPELEALPHAVDADLVQFVDRQR